MNKGYVAPRNAEKNAQTQMITPATGEVHTHSPKPKTPIYEGVPGYKVETQQAEYLRSGAENGKPLP